MGILAILAEALSLIQPGITVTESLVALFQRAKDLLNAPTPATDEELAAFKQMIADEKAKLDANTVEIEKD